MGSLRFHPIGQKSSASFYSHCRSLRRPSGDSGLPWPTWWARPCLTSVSGGQVAKSRVGGWVSILAQRWQGGPPHWMSPETSESTWRRWGRAPFTNQDSVRGGPNKSCDLSKFQNAPNTQVSIESFFRLRTRTISKRMRKKKTIIKHQYQDDTDIRIIWQAF